MVKSLLKLISAKSGKKRTVLPVVWFFVSAAGVSFMLLGTTPDRVGPLGITLFFLLVFISLLALGTLVRNLLLKEGGSGSLLFVILLAAAITSALAIGTIELQIGDVVLLALFVATFSVYWTRLR